MLFHKTRYAWFKNIVFFHISNIQLILWFPQTLADIYSPLYEYIIIFIQKFPVQQEQHRSTEVKVELVLLTSVVHLNVKDL